MPQPTHTPEWYDRQYNNRALIPEHPAIFARWATDSASARERLAQRSKLDLPFGADLDDETQRLDVFVPPPSMTDGAHVPVLVFIHGGYWRSLDKRDFSFVAEAFADAGALVVVPNYTLCPQVTIPEITMQVMRAIAWTCRHAQDFGGDASRLVVSGHSAGGHLAAMAVCCRWRLLDPGLPAHPVTKALSISGLFDLEPLRHAAFVAPDLRLTEASAFQVSPAWMPAPRGTLVAVVGADETDEFRRHNRLIRQRWGARVVSVCEEVPGRHHLDVLDDLVAPSHQLHRLTLGLLGLESR